MQISLAWRIAAILVTSGVMALVAAMLGLVPAWQARGVLTEVSEHRLPELREVLAESIRRPKALGGRTENPPPSRPSAQGSGPAGLAPAPGPQELLAGGDPLTSHQQWLASQTTRVRQWTWLATFGAAGLALLAVGLNLAVAGLLFGKVFGPLRRLVFRMAELSAEGAGTPREAGDALAVIHRWLDTLLARMADAQTSVANSRARMLGAEKLALVGKLAAGVAHEIRNPLASIRMWLYSLRKSLAGQADPLRKLAVIEEEVGRLAKIVEDFLAFSRPAEPRPGPEDPEGLIRGTVALLAHSAAEKQLALHLDIEAGLPQILVDPDQFRQVLVNLLNNAVEATPAGGWIRIAAGRWTTQDGAGVLFRVRDSGGGIPPEVQAHLFEPFVTTKEHGTGLGLCIAARLVQQHRGFLALEATGAEGTTFRFWIPAAAGASP